MPIVNGTTYDIRTPDKVVKVLEQARTNKTRLKIVYGDGNNGRVWEDFPIIGRIGRSMGPVKIPIILFNSRSMGGCGILDHCIVKIEHSNSKSGGVLYRHPQYHEKSTTQSSE
jgi:hypothetical protein